MFILVIRIINILPTIIIIIISSSIYIYLSPLKNFSIFTYIWINNLILLYYIFQKNSI